MRIDYRTVSDQDRATRFTNPDESDFVSELFTTPSTNAVIDVIDNAWIVEVTETCQDTGEMLRPVYVRKTVFD